MVEAVWRNGFAATTMREVVGLAGVSNTTFYKHFDSLQDCFLAAFDEIMAASGARITEAYLGASGFPGSLEAALKACR